LLLEGAAGERRFVATFSRRPLAEFQDLELAGSRDDSRRAAQLERKRGQVLDLAQGYRPGVAAGRVVVERVNEATPGEPKEKAVYAVDAKPEPESRVVVEIPLRWREER
jgi:hypothetical protein